MQSIIKTILLKFRYIIREYGITNIYYWKMNEKELKALKGIHSGERCFIIGNGPSLKPEDLSLIKNEISFASNRIFYIYQKTSWRPTYYCVEDEDVFNDIKNELNNVSKDSNKCFFASFCGKHLSKESRNNNKMLFFFARTVAAHKKRKFSDDISSYVDGGGTITYAAMQIAAFMGIKEIYLLGVDHNYSASSYNNGQLNSDDIKGSYFEGMPSSIKLNKPNTDNATISYLEAQKYATDNEIRIFNSTRGGKLEVFQRKKLEEVISK